jgi:hypothetical protein
MSVYERVQHPEILQEVFLHVDRPTLASLMLVSHAFFDVAASILYCEIKLFNPQGSAPPIEGWDESYEGDTRSRSLSHVQRLIFGNHDSAHCKAVKGSKKSRARAPEGAPALRLPNLRSIVFRPYFAGECCGLSGCAITAELRPSEVVIEHTPLSGGYAAPAMAIPAEMGKALEKLTVVTYSTKQLPAVAEYVAANAANLSNVTVVLHEEPPENVSADIFKQAFKTAAKAGMDHPNFNLAIEVPMWMETKYKVLGLWQKAARKEIKDRVLVVAK